MSAGPVIVHSHLVQQQRVERMVLCLAAILDTIPIHPVGEAGHCFRYAPDTDADRGELDRDLCGAGLTRATDAEVESGGRADGVRGLIAGAE